MNKILIFLLSFSCFIAYGQSPKELDSLTTILETVYHNDQDLRLSIDSINKKYGFDSDESKQLWNSIEKNDSTNLIFVSTILDKYGWLSAEQTSSKANKALFLVIQHANLQVQLKYLALLRDASISGKANRSDYALLLDRTNMYQGKFQEYGSQVIMNHGLKCYFYPIKDEPNVDFRRNQVGLSKLDEYAKLFNINYSLPLSDSSKNKNIIYGFICDPDYNYLPNVKIYSGNRLLTESDENGYYSIKTKKRSKKLKIRFSTPGYQEITGSITIIRDKDVYDQYIIMKKNNVSP